MWVTHTCDATTTVGTKDARHDGDNHQDAVFAGHDWGTNPSLRSRATVCQELFTYNVYYLLAPTLISLGLNMVLSVSLLRLLLPTCWPLVGLLFVVVVVVVRFRVLVRVLVCVGEGADRFAFHGVAGVL